MNHQSNKVLLRINVYSDSRYKGLPLYEQIVLKVKKLGLAGATVIRGMMGFIGEDRIHKPKMMSLTESLPVTIEVVDTQENINKILPFLDGAVQQGLVLLSPVVKR